MVTSNLFCSYHMFLYHGPRPHDTYDCQATCRPTNGSITGSNSCHQAAMLASPASVRLWRSALGSVGIPPAPVTPLAPVAPVAPVTPVTPVAPVAPVFTMVTWRSGHKRIIAAASDLRLPSGRILIVFMMFMLACTCQIMSVHCCVDVSQGLLTC